ncbi:MAG: class I SAM-dependent methyltransferase [Candidatus Omnitrophica bacterium]|nr:class I SAM-dependent methyltransferase [Candidatus Omnitrophota bacterium]
MEDKRKIFFDRHAENWDCHLTHHNLARVVEEAEIEKGAIICDVGTGTGVLVPLLHRKVGKKGKIIAIDYSSEMIKKAKEKYGKLPVEFIVADIHKTDFPDNYFDYVICNACFPHFENKKMALKEIYRILKKEGIIVISHPTGKEFVNKLHKETGGCIKKDRVPPGIVLARTLKEFNFTPLKVIDEPEFYLVSAVKS